MVEGEKRKLTSKEILCKLLFKAFGRPCQKPVRKPYLVPPTFVTNEVLVMNQISHSDESDFLAAPS